MDDSIWAKLWEDDYDVVLRLTTRDLGDPAAAEDIVMAAMGYMSARLQRGDVPDNPGAVLQATVSKLVKREYRRRGRARRLKDRLGRFTQAATKDQPFVTDELTSTIRALPGDLRPPWVLRHLRGCTIDETSALLGTSRSETHRRTTAANDLMKEALL